MKKILYIDLDSVVVNYMKGIEGLDEEQRKKRILEPGFFLNLEPIENAIENVNLLAVHYDVYFASTAPWSNVHSASEKRIWVEKYFPITGHKRLILTHRKNLLIGDYLIDDRLHNGAGKFTGKLLHFGSEEFPDWDSCMKYLLSRI